MIDLKSLIRDVPGFPRSGVMFKDITPLLADAHALAQCLDSLAAPWRDRRVEVVCAMESRGFIFGTALARDLGAGFVPLRKPGKLPAKTLGVDFDLEYGAERLEVHADAIASGARVLIVDDVLATGGTLGAARQLVDMSGGQLLGAAMVIELGMLNGRRDWPSGLPLTTLVRY